MWLGVVGKLRSLGFWGILGEFLIVESEEVVLRIFSKGFSPNFQICQMGNLPNVQFEILPFSSAKNRH
ncbi:MAG: hypothetical protein A3D31_07405 [Candidatus Fluviicola riflensis]|nr:MAG: hypothetical protein CHH17_07605 [Candidatus Fluviicola riflensis]OGS79773.1 MAG: hypothetical protein A3D31_07405 [Candidatus Fluviicola riflensis]OGS87206.1 MAG: hypothetical protein A2724_06865 [Fluviicola sp. RIFCSPHIGHO2_01_FULL_43_53]OGS89994.1 MAG: hypothetical protein A3E30_03610 [Fluviicola sp. RIFCSPHIGHO2_12_FULL_43_24]